jgi:hypothetical protein
MGDRLDAVADRGEDPGHQPTPVKGCSSSIGLAFGGGGQQPLLAPEAADDGLYRDPGAACHLLTSGGGKRAATVLVGRRPLTGYAAADRVLK